MFSHEQLKLNQEGDKPLSNVKGEEQWFSFKNRTQDPKDTRNIFKENVFKAETDLVFFYKLCDVL